MPPPMRMPSATSTFAPKPLTGNLDHSVLSLGLLKHASVKANSLLCRWLCLTGVGLHISSSQI